MTRRYRPRPEVAELLRAGASYRQVHEQLGVSKGIITATRKAYGIPTAASGPGFRRTAEERARLEQQTITLLLQGVSYRRIREQLDVSQPTIVAIRRQAGLPVPTSDYVRPSRTVAEVLALYCEPYGDGHVRWTGPRRGRALQLCAEGHRYNARRVLFEAHHRRPPRGYVLQTCTEPWCIEGSHLADAAMRLARRR